MTHQQKARYFDAATVPLSLEPLSTPSKDALKHAQKSTHAKGTDKEEMSHSSLDNIEVKEFDLSDPSPKKSKKIAKSSTEYISFFKFHYKKLHSEHRKWTTAQISTVIKLLWKKKKTSMKRSHSMMRTRAIKPISGRKFFLRMKKDQGMSPENRMRSWKRLPKESKMNWSKKGNPAMEVSSMKMRTLTFPSAQPDMTMPLNFLTRT